MKRSRLGSSGRAEVRRRAMVVLLVGTLFLAACSGAGGSDQDSDDSSGEGKPQGTLTLAYSSIGDKIGHPLDLVINQQGDLANLRYDLLVGRDPETLQPVPGIAESWEVVDDTTYRFELREGVVFHDGSSLDADDVKASLEAFVSQQAIDLGIEDFCFSPWLEGVDVIDEYTVEVKATKPWRLALPSMALCSRIFPAESAEKIDLSEPPPGSGPYKFVEFSPEDRYVLEANERYWGEPPAFERIEVRSIPEPAALVAALRAGEVDWISHVPGDDVERLKQEGFEVNSIPSIRHLWIGFDFEKEGPWSELEVRKAMNLALDRDAINEALYGGMAFPAIAPEAHVLPFVPQDLEPYTYDPDEARSLLAEAGYPDGFSGATLGTSNGHYLQDRQLVEVIQGYLSEVGIDVKVNAMPPETYFEKSPEFDLGLGGWTATEGDPAAGIAPQVDFQFPWTLGGYEKLHPEIADLIRESSNVINDDEASTELYGELFRRLWDDAVRIYLFELPMVWANVPELEGFEAVPTDNFNWGTAHK